MAKKAAVELVGLEDMEKILNQLPKTFQKQVLSAAVKEAGKPLLEKAKQNLATVQWGASLTRYLRQVARTVGGLPGTEVGFVAPKRGKRAALAWRAMGAYWMEYGTMEYMTKPRESGSRSLASAQKKVGVPPSKRGRIPASGWLRNAIDTTEEQVIQNMRYVLWKTLNKKLLSRAKKIKWSGLQ